MNKISLALSVTAVTALVGCLDPKYNGKVPLISQTTPPTQPSVQQTQPAEVEPVPVEVEPVPTIEVTPVESQSTPAQQPVQVKPAPATPPPAAAETTTYIIQPGDTLSKISKRYNITIAAIKRVNPQIKDDNKVKLGQKIQLPGKVDVGEQKVPAGAIARPTKASTTVKPHTPYTGATKEYVVKSGDSLSTIASKQGCTVRQLKELNGLSSDMVRIGQKLKIPAEKATSTVVDSKTKPTGTAKSTEPAKTAKPSQTPEAQKPVKVDNPEQGVAAPEPTAAEPSAPASVPVPAPVENEFDSYTVQEGDDVTSISILTSVSPTEIRQLNNLSDDAELKPGKVLRLPAGSIQ